jgi:regulatory protein
LNDSDSYSADEAYQRGVSLLARRDHSMAELRGKLLARGIPAPRVESALERLARHGYLNDRRFAERWAESALRGGKYVGSRLLLELQRRGVARETAEEALAAVSVDHGEGEVLAALVAKRYASFDPASATLQERRRVYAYLLRRGFSPGTIGGYLRGTLGDE